MKFQDYLGLAFFEGFGLWWLLFPNNVIRFYGWFHRRKVSMPRQNLVRAIGALWMALVLGVTLYSLK